MTIRLVGKATSYVSSLPLACPFAFIGSLGFDPDITELDSALLEDIAFEPNIKL